MRCTTAVTAPIVRIHPAVVAQAAATAAVLFEGRFRLGVGSGEALNEHIVCTAWPTADVRLEMLEEAVGILRALWTRDLVRHRGTHYTVDTARLYTLPDEPPPILVSGFGPKSTALAARIGDGWVSTSPDAQMLAAYRAAGGRGPMQGGVKVCWSADPATARRHVHRLWGHSAIPGEFNQILPSPAHFEQLAWIVTEEMAVEGKAVGNRVEDFVEAVRAYVEAGFDEVYLSQIGPEQDGFFDFWERELRPAVQALSSSGRPVAAEEQVGQLLHQLGPRHRMGLQPPVPRRLHHPDDAVTPRRRAAGRDADLGGDALREQRRQPAGERAHLELRLRSLRRRHPRIQKEAVDLRLPLDRQEVRVDRPLHPVPTPPAGLQCGLQVGEQLARVAVGEGGVEPALVPEVPVEDWFGDAGLDRDAHHRRSRAVPSDDAVGGVEQRLPPAR